MRLSSSKTSRYTRRKRAERYCRLLLCSFLVSALEFDFTERRLRGKSSNKIDRRGKDRVLPILPIAESNGSFNLAAVCTTNDTIMEKEKQNKNSATERLRAKS